MGNGKRKLHAVREALLVFLALRQAKCPRCTSVLDWQIQKFAGSPDCTLAVLISVMHVHCTKLSSAELVLRLQVSRKRFSNSERLIAKFKMVRRCHI